MTPKQKVIIHAEKNYNSSPCEYTDAELETLIENECACSNCGKSIFDLDDFPVIRDELVYCPDCERELFMQDCPVCEELFFSPETPEGHCFFVSAKNGKALKVKPGLYQVMRFPYQSGDVLFGFDALVQENITLVRAMDIESILREIGLKKDVSCECVCPDCVGKYTEARRIKTRWCNMRTGVHRNITERGAIRRGY